MQSAAIRGNQHATSGNQRPSGGHQEVIRRSSEGIRRTCSSFNHRIRVAIRGTQRTHLLELLALASLLSLLLLFEFRALLSLLLIVLPLTLRVGFLELRQPLRIDELLWGNVGRNQPPSVGNGRHQPPSGR